MLYYIIKFIKLVFSEPGKIVQHYRRLRQIWEDDRTSRRVNEVVHVCTGDWNLIYGSQSYYSRIICHITVAKYTIDIAMFFMGLDPILKALKAAHGRGVRVRLICEKNFANIQATYGDCLELRTMSSTLNRASRFSSMHHKFCVIDGYRSKQRFHKEETGPAPLTIAMTGSINWGSQVKNYEDLLITSSTKIAKRLEAEFERMWQLTNCRNSNADC